MVYVKKKSSLMVILVRVIIKKLKTGLTATKENAMFYTN